MKMVETKAQPLERLLAEALRYGTWAASVAIIIGLMLPKTALVTAGIALFILLPVMRVILMLGAFLRLKDYRMSAVAGLVLLIIVLGCVLGTMPAFHA
jgi:uncharacterized membrane protein